MTPADIEAYRRNARLADEWWLAVDDSVLDEPLSLRAAVEVGRKAATTSLCLLNVAESADARPEWLDLDLPADPPKPGSAGTSETGPVETSKPGSAGAARDSTVESPAVVGGAQTQGPDPVLQERVGVLETRVELLQLTVDAILDMLREVDGFDKLRATLEERQSFIQASEEQLLQRSFELEERTAELEQKMEDTEPPVA